MKTIRQNRQLALQKTVRTVVCASLIGLMALAIEARAANSPLYEVSVEDDRLVTEQLDSRAKVAAETSETMNAVSNSDSSASDNSDWNLSDLLDDSDLPSAEQPVEKTAATESNTKAKKNDQKASAVTDSKSPKPSKSEDSQMPASFIPISSYVVQDTSVSFQDEAPRSSRRAPVAGQIEMPRKKRSFDELNMVEMAASLRKLDREKADAKHLPLFEEPIRRMVDVLDEHEQNWLQTDQMQLARLAEKLREEGQRRLSARRVTYSWAHQFVLRSILLFERETSKSASLRTLLGDADRFNRAFANSFANEPALQGFKRQLNDVRFLISGFPQIVVEPSVFETASLSAPVVDNSENTQNRVYTIQAAPTVKDLEGREQSPLALYLNTASHAVQNHIHRLPSGH